MTFYEKMTQRRQERDRLVEWFLFGMFIFAASVYFSAHVLAAIQQGRLPLREREIASASSAAAGSLVTTIG